MEYYSPKFSRRRLLTNLAAGIVSLPVLKLFGEEKLRLLESGYFWEELEKTPALTEGPFYPDRLPMDRDNDLLVIGKGDRALGEVTHLSGKVMDRSGEPVKGVTVEIWQVDHHGVYLHSGSDNPEKRDKAFQGFGQFETASDGQYRFRTIKPVPYPGRTPHIHVKVKKGDRELLTTQCHVAGHPMLARDGVISSLQTQAERDLVIAKFIPMKDSAIGELAARFDIVLGATPFA